MQFQDPNDEVSDPTDLAKYLMALCSLSCQASFQSVGAPRSEETALSEPKFLSCSVHGTAIDQIRCAPLCGFYSPRTRSGIRGLVHKSPFDITFQRCLRNQVNICEGCCAGYVSAAFHGFSHCKPKCWSQREDKTQAFWFELEL